MAFVKHSDYGPDSGRELDWRQDSACREYDPDWWTPVSYNTMEAEWATWVCNRECPVRVQCQEWAQANLTLCSGAIYGGTLYTVDTAGHRQVRPSLTQPMAVAPGDEREIDRRRGYFRFQRHDRTIRSLLASGLSQTEVARRIGCNNKALSAYLAREAA